MYRFRANPARLHISIPCRQTCTRGRSDPCQQPLISRQVAGTLRESRKPECENWKPKKKQKRSSQFSWGISRGSGSRSRSGGKKMMRTMRVWRHVRVDSPKMWAPLYTYLVVHSPGLSLTLQILSGSPPTRLQFIASTAIPNFKFFLIY